MQGCIAEGQALLRIMYAPNTSLCLPEYEPLRWKDPLKVGVEIPVCHPQKIFTRDAFFGWGATAQGKWSSHEPSRQLNILELREGHYPCQHSLHDRKGPSGRVTLDNSTALYYVNCAAWLWYWYISPHTDTSVVYQQLQTPCCLSLKTYF